MTLARYPSESATIIRSAHPAVVGHVGRPAAYVTRPDRVAPTTDPRTHRRLRGFDTRASNSRNPSRPTTTTEQMAKAGIP